MAIPETIISIYLPVNSSLRKAYVSGMIIMVTPDQMTRDFSTHSEKLSVPVAMRRTTIQMNPRIILKSKESSISYPKILMFNKDIVFKSLKTTADL